MNDDQKMKRLLQDSIGEPPQASTDEMESIQNRIESEEVLPFPNQKKFPSFVWPSALAASIALFLFFLVGLPSRNVRESNGEMAEFVYESLATSYEESYDSDLYDPWLELAEYTEEETF